MSVTAICADQGLMMNPDIHAKVAQSRTWAIEQALPLWSSAGIDPHTGGFRERLSFEGAPILEVPHRMMVQCRQISVFSLAHSLGWYEGEAIVARAAEHLIRTYYQADGRPGWVFSVDLDGRPIDARRDTYSHSFALFGLAWAYRATQNPLFIKVVEETLEFLDQDIAARAYGGLLDGDVRTDLLRRQNPHMHFFEAMISLAQATGKDRYLARAGEIFGLLTTRLFQPETGTLGEYFDDTWQPHGTPHHVCEPGHHFEWVWLLRWYERMSGRSVERYTAPLYEHAYRYGFDSAGFVLDEVTLEGTPSKISRRSWPHTEGVKANAVEHEAGRKGCEARAAALLDKLFNTYLSAPVAGGWVDHIDETGRPLVNYMPASTLYHVLFAIAEADRVFGHKSESALPVREPLAAADSL